MEFSAYADWAIALANSVEKPGHQDALSSVDGLKAFLKEVTHGGHQAGRADLAPLRDIRDQVRGVFEANAPSVAASRLNQVFAVSEFAPHMAYSSEQGWHLHPASSKTPTWRWLAAACGLGLTYLLMDYGADRLGVCASPECRNVFLDLSRPNIKRFCSARCANRAHTNAFRRRGRVAARRSGFGPG